MEPYITLSEAMRRTGICRATMFRYLNSGLNFITIGRNRFVKESEVKQMIENKQTIMMSGNGGKNE